LLGGIAVLLARTGCASEGWRDPKDLIYKFKLSIKPWEEQRGTAYKILLGGEPPVRVPEAA